MVTHTQTHRKTAITLPPTLGLINNHTLLFYDSMGECEAICNRIGILIKGEFRCIGSTEELKAK